MPGARDSFRGTLAFMDKVYDGKSRSGKPAVPANGNRLVRLVIRDLWDPGHKKARKLRLPLRSFKTLHTGQINLGFERCRQGGLAPLIARDLSQMNVSLFSTIWSLVTLALGYFVLLITQASSHAFMLCLWHSGNKAEMDTPVHLST